MKAPLKTSLKKQIPSSPMLINKITLTCATLACVTSNLSAAVLLTTSVNDVVSETDVSTQGTLIKAYNFTTLAGANPVASSTANGVDFLHVTMGSGNDNLRSGTTELSYLDGRPSNITTSHGAYGTGGLSGGYGELMNSAIYRNGTTSTGFQFGLGNLAAGTYELQIWISDTRTAGFNRSASLSLTTGVNLQTNTTFSSGTQNLGNLGTIDYNVGDTVGNLGQYITARFELTGSENGLVINGTASGANHQQINAFQLRAVPEPSSSLLLLAGALGLSLRRHRA
ncbi:hypothetical protein NT6N_15090 [Oceaniferula spumae]|uniref:Ice-binding protein C-terminal domain-containing protein n=1 Tax=Oceaniferula spumae TaxID=2979115 RepID=A0AAT9FKI6_9BACT